MTETETKTDDAKAEKTAKPEKQEAKKLHVRVLRAVDRYHHRGALITVPNDDYHKSLVRIGVLVVEREV